MFERSFGILLLSSLVFLLGGCGAPSSFDPSTATGKQAILDQTNVYLSNQDCKDALLTLSPLYNSPYTDNETRLLMASVYACSANINFFSLLGQFVTDATTLESGLWNYLAQVFPSVSTDSVVASANYGMSALQAAITPGSVIAANDYINQNSYNPGTVLVADRVSDSDLYMIFVAMAEIGALENRYGNPTAPTYNKTANLPWTSASLVTSDGCQFASALVNLSDAVTQSTTLISGNFGNVISSISNQYLGGSLDIACSAGCTLCGLSCATCPLTLRNPTTCTGLSTDVNSCAAAALVQVVNASWP